MKTNYPTDKFIVFISIQVLLLALAFAYLHYINRPDERVNRLSKKAIYVLAENPSSINILSIGSPEKIYGNQMLKDSEQEEISSAMMRLNKFIMDRTDNLFNFDEEDAVTMDLMEIHMNTVTTIRALSALTDEAVKDCNQQTGWKQTIEYEAVSEKGVSYRSSFWFFFDREGEILTHYFEVPLIDG